MIVTSHCGILESYRDTVPLAPIPWLSLLADPRIKRNRKKKRKRKRRKKELTNRKRYDELFVTTILDSRSIRFPSAFGGIGVRWWKKRMEGPRKPVVNTVTIRLDVRETAEETKVDETKKWEKWRRKKGGGERVAVDVPMCSSTKSINLVCSSEHVGQQCPLREQPRRTSLRPLFRPRFHVAGVPGEGGRGALPSLPPSSSVANNIGVARNYPCLDGTRRRVLQRTGHCWKTARVPLLEIRYAASSVESHGATCVLERWWSRGKPLEPDGEGFGWPNFWLPASRRNPPPLPASPILVHFPRFLPSEPTFTRDRDLAVLPILPICILHIPCFRWFNESWTSGGYNQEYNRILVVSSNSNCSIERIRLSGRIYFILISFPVRVLPSWRKDEYFPIRNDSFDS